MSSICWTAYCNPIFKIQIQVIIFELMTILFFILETPDEAGILSAIFYLHLLRNPGPSQGRRNVLEVGGGGGANMGVVRDLF